MRLWVVIVLILIWALVCVVVIALAVSAGRIDKGLGRRAARRPHARARTRDTSKTE